MNTFKLMLVSLIAFTLLGCSKEAANGPMQSFRDSRDGVKWKLKVESYASSPDCERDLAKIKAQPTYISNGGTGMNFSCGTEPEATSANLYFYGTGFGDFHDSKTQRNDLDLIFPINGGNRTKMYLLCEEIKSIFRHSNDRYFEDDAWVELLGAGGCTEAREDESSRVKAMIKQFGPHWRLSITAERNAI